MLGGHASDPPIGPAGYKRMKERRPCDRDGWLTMPPYSGRNWCTFFEAVGHPECIERIAAARHRSPRATLHQMRSYYKMADIVIT